MLHKVSSYFYQLILFTKPLPFQFSIEDPFAKVSDLLPLSPFRVSCCGLYHRLGGIGLFLCIYHVCSVSLEGGPWGSYTSLPENAKGYRAYKSPSPPFRTELSSCKDF